MLTDEIPAFTEIVPDSITYIGAGGGSKTTAVDVDQAEVDGGVLTARIGAGASSDAGGTLVVNDTTTITFRVTVLDGNTNGSTIDNQATATYSSGADLDFEAASPVDRRPVRVVSDLSIVKAASPRDVVLSGGTITWTLQVRNAGPSADPAVVITDEIPAGVTVTGLPADCTQAGQTVTCTIGELAANAHYNQHPDHRRPSMPALPATR